MMPPGFSATTPTTSWFRSWTVNATLVFAMVVSPSTRATSRSRPNDGGWAYSRKVLSEPLGRSATRPNRVRPCEPPVSRSSPLTEGPSFLMWIVMAIHDPTRACPASIARPSMVRPSAAPADAGRIARPRTGMASARSDRIRRRAAIGRRRAPAMGGCRSRTWTPSGGRVVVGARTSHPVGKLRAGVSVAPSDRGSAGLSPSRPSLSYDARVPQPFGRSCRPPGARRRHPKVPCPRSDPSAPCASIHPPSATSPWSSPRHTTSSAATSTPACWRATRPTSCAWTCPRMRPATSPTTAIGARPGRWPPGARAGSCARTRIRRSTSTSRPTACPAPTSSGPSAGSSRASASGRSARRPACWRTSGRCPGRRRTATSSCGRPA